MIKEIHPARTLRGAIIPPPDKSISQRAAIFALLHGGDSIIGNYSTAQDPQSALDCVAALGATIRKTASGALIRGVGRNGLTPNAGEIYCGNSGTALRLLSGVIAGAGIKATLTGDASLSSRTMTRILNPLRRMGAGIEAAAGDVAPLKFTGREELIPIEFELPIASAQLKSCVLLAGLFGKTPTRVIEKVPSRDHTERLLNLPIMIQCGRTVISSSVDNEIPAQTYSVPGDFSSAAFWLAAGAIHPDAEIRISAVGLNPTRTAFSDILRQMGADIRVEDQRFEGEEPVGDVIVSSSKLNAVEVGGTIIPNCIDELPVLAVVMAFAEGTSVISGAGELRHKETDRLKAISGLLSAAGINHEENDDGLVIHGNPHHHFKSAGFESYHDHRIAMAAAVLAQKSENASLIKDAECAAVSYPQFWNDLQSLAR